MLSSEPRNQWIFMWVTDGGRNALCFSHMLILMWITIALTCSEWIYVVIHKWNFRENSAAISDATTIPQAFLCVLFWNMQVNYSEWNNTKYVWEVLVRSLYLTQLFMNGKEQREGQLLYKGVPSSLSYSLALLELLLQGVCSHAPAIAYMAQGHADHTHNGLMNWN